MKVQLDFLKKEYPLEPTATGVFCGFYEAWLYADSSSARTDRLGLLSGIRDARPVPGHMQFTVSASIIY